MLIIVLVLGKSPLTPLHKYCSAHVAAALYGQELPLHVSIPAYIHIFYPSNPPRHYVQQATSEKRRLAAKRPRTLSNANGKLVVRSQNAYIKD
jgi:hypothetical protein